MMTNNYWLIAHVRQEQQINTNEDESVWQAQLRLENQTCLSVRVRGSNPVADSQNSGFHPFEEVSKWVSTNTNIVWMLYEKLRIAGTEEFTIFCVT